eukprot:TRINITY_DN8550_c0_g1_i1.p1 TRINITY_DN8550_c0_g1~~TRINITY_DN8550_c0_g1_i1.p1  ORF type:complete len:377 (+),score=59.13 TRINITY_DN8550_c0_g1_i1:168-1298(+)
MHTRYLVIALVVVSSLLTCWNAVGVSRLQHKSGVPYGLPERCSVLVTGSAGFIGMHVALNIQKNGGRVVGIDTYSRYYNPEIKERRAKELASHNITVYNATICDRSEVTKLLLRHNITHVVHLAAQPGIGLSIKKPEEYVHVNVQCFTSLMEGMRSAGVSNLVYASSSSVYGSVSPPFRESQLPSPTNVYGASKLQSEILASVYHRLYDFNVVGLRFFTVYGPWMRPDMAVYKFASKMYLNKTIHIKGKGLQRDFTYVGDVVTAVRSVLWYLDKKNKKKKDAVDEVFNIGRSDPFPIDDLPNLLHSHFSKETSMDVVYTSSVAYNMKYTSADVTKAETHLGFKASIDVFEGVDLFMKWFQHNKDWCAKAALDWEVD